MLIERQQPEIARALHGTALNPERFTRIALTTLRQTPELMRCRPESVLGALMTSAQLGLEPGPLGHAYLVPYKDECTFILGYKGIVKLAWQSGQLRHIDAAEVCEADLWEYERGAEPVLRHRPALTERGPIIAYYAVATLLGGGHVARVLSPDDVEAVRKRAASSRSAKSPWHTDYVPMARKTCVRALAPLLPMATTLHTALSVDESTRDGVGADLADVSTGWIDGDTVDEVAEPPAADTERPPPPEQPTPNPPEIDEGTSP